MLNKKILIITIFFAVFLSSNVFGMKRYTFQEGQEEELRESLIQKFNEWKSWRTYIGGSCHPAPSEDAELQYKETKITVKAYRDKMDIFNQGDETPVMIIMPEDRICEVNDDDFYKALREKFTVLSELPAYIRLSVLERLLPDKKYFDSSSGSYYFGDGKEIELSDYLRNALYGIGEYSRSLITRDVIAKLRYKDAHIDITINSSGVTVAVLDSSGKPPITLGQDFKHMLCEERVSYLREQFPELGLPDLQKARLDEKQRLHEKSRKTNNQYNMFLAEFAAAFVGCLFLLIGEKFKQREGANAKKAIFCEVLSNLAFMVNYGASEFGQWYGERLTYLDMSASVSCAVRLAMIVLLTKKLFASAQEDTKKELENQDNVLRKSSKIIKNKKIPKKNVVAKIENSLCMIRAMLAFSENCGYLEYKKRSYLCTLGILLLHAKEIQDKADEYDYPMLKKVAYVLGAVPVIAAAGDQFTNKGCL